MNCAKFKDPVSHTCLTLTGAVISYTRGGWVTGSSHFAVMTNIFVTKFSECSENIY